jgi:endonuclease/exonuclease/phosphatase family metal-dependent hydrolase
VRIATFNLLHGRSLDDGRVDVDRLAAAVKSLDADVLGLQEVDRDQPRSQGADLVAVAAEAMGTEHFRMLPALAGTPGSWRAATGAELAGVPLYGVGLVSRHPVQEWQAVRLPTLRGRVPMVFRERRTAALVADEPRVALVARIETPAGSLSVATTHLSFLPGWNVLQLRHLLRALPTENPLVLTGDLNLPPRAVARVTRMRPLASRPTFPAHVPRVQLDHLLARGDVTATAEAETPELGVSDHRALVVSVRLGG